MQVFWPKTQDFSIPENIVVDHMLSLLFQLQVSFAIKENKEINKLITIKN